MKYIINEIFKCLFLLIFSVVAFCGNDELEINWEELSYEINSSLDVWTKEVASYLETATIQSLIQGLQSINREYDSQIFMDIRRIFSANGDFIKELSEERIGLILYCIRNKFPEHIVTASTNYLTKMRKKKSVDLHDQKKENMRPNHNASTESTHSRERYSKEHPAIRRIKDEEL